MLRKSIITATVMIALCGAAFAAVEDFNIRGHVKAEVTKADLTDAWVYILDKDLNPADSVQANKGFRWTGSGTERMSDFYFTVPRCDSTYVMRVSCPGFSDKMLSFEVKNVGKRESWRQIPVTFLTKAPRQLGEVTVTATKIKFYNRGDTIVYNADAFELAEGSMLDALVAQLPGVELHEGGVIKVNGEQVESLLLNGKEFFNKDNELMLENIGAYTVKNIEVYKGQTTEEKFLGKTDTRHLTMDVKLKREYNTGLVANAQAGYGTEDRYMGRLFGMWFTPTNRLTLIGNINNLNDTRKPGQNDSWSPDKLPSGTKKFRQVGLDHQYESASGEIMSMSDVIFKWNGEDNRNTLERTNFLPGGNTLDLSRSVQKIKSLNLSGGSRFLYKSSIAKAGIGVDLQGGYTQRNNELEDNSETRMETERADASAAMNAIFNAATVDEFSSMLNTTSTRSDGSSKEYNVGGAMQLIKILPKSDDVFRDELKIDFKSSKEDIWKNYDVTFGSGQAPEHRRQYIDNSPNRRLSLKNTFGYQASLKHWNMSIEYEYSFLNKTSDSYLYALDRLADDGVFGVLPVGWASTLDEANSYRTHLIDNSHSLIPRVIYNNYKKDKSWIYASISPKFTLKHCNLAYNRDNRDINLRKNFFLTTLGGWNARIQADFRYRYEKTEDDNEAAEERKGRFTNTLECFFTLTPQAPDMLDLADFTDTSNPLNIYTGNPGLKTQYTFGSQIEWRLRPFPMAHPIENMLRVSTSHTDRALTRGYTYDTATGVRHSMTYNVNGNASYSARNEFKIQFGPINQFTVSSTTEADHSTYADMIGTDVEMPEPRKVRTLRLRERASFSWQIGRQNLKLFADFTSRRTTSPDPAFRDINARHYIAGFTGQFKLPAGFGIGTDFTMYCRDGYGMSQIDDTNLIWNARVTWTPPRAKAWTIMADGFDMLHQLKTVNYAVTASGRSVGYTNALPRYFMLSVQYRFNRQPKKR